LSINKKPFISMASIAGLGLRLGDLELRRLVGVG
jgi:hypothetical protein